MKKIDKKCSNCGCEEFFYTEEAKRNTTWLNIFITICAFGMCLLFIVGGFNVLNATKALVLFILEILLLISLLILIIARLWINGKNSRTKRICKNCEMITYVESYKKVIAINEDNTIDEEQ